MADTVATILAQNPVIGQANPQTLAKLAPACKLLELGANRTILRHGETARSVFVLSQGGVRVFHRGAPGEELVVKLLGPPAIIGDSGVLLGRPSLESVKTVKPSVLVEIPPALFLRMHRAEPKFAAALGRDLAARLLIASEHSRQIAVASAEARLASFLLDHMALFGEPSESGVRLSTPLTQTSISRDLALSRKTVNRVFVRWEKDGLILVEGKHVEIQNPDALRALTSTTRFGLAYSVQ